MDSTDRTIEDSEDICLEILAGRLLCRECSIDPQGSTPELDFRAYCSEDPTEFTAHLLKHSSLRQHVRQELLSVELWEYALQTQPQGSQAAR